MQPHEERVIVEKAHLDEKLEKLKNFCFKENAVFKTLLLIDRNLLEEQYIAMRTYSEILRKRIARFGD